MPSLHFFVFFFFLHFLFFFRYRALLELDPPSKSIANAPSERRGDGPGDGGRVEQPRQRLSPRERPGGCLGVVSLLLQFLQSAAFSRLQYLLVQQFRLCRNRASI